MILTVRSCISDGHDFFPDLQQQLNKLTVIRYDSIQSTNAQSDEELRRRRHTNKRTKVSSFCRVCDNMLAEGRITKANHTRWTNIF